MTSHLPNRDHDYDGRPAVDALVTNWRLGEDDPLLAALIRCHPEHIPPELVAKLASQSARC